MVTFLTNNGTDLMNQVIGAESVLNFTKIQFGNGTNWSTEDSSSLRQEIAEATELQNVVKEVAFDNEEGSVTIDSETGLALLYASFSNIGDDYDWHATEIGIFAQDGDDTSTEILYAVSAVDVSKAAWVPTQSESAATFEYSVYVYVGDVADVTAVLAVDADKASKQDLEDHIYNMNNPHETTKYQVGLGNVPNVTTNDQRPFFTASTELSELNGGSQINPDTQEEEGVDTLATILGQIKTAVKAFIDHRGDNTNPHKVTAAQVNAAAVKHYHSANDINADTLDPLHGGTKATFNESTPLKSTENCAVTLWTEESGNKLLKQGGFVNVDGNRLWVPFAKEFKDTRYTLTFQTSGNSFIPLWKNVEKHTNGFYMNRTIGIDSSKIKDWMKGLFPFSQSMQSKIDELFGASQAADWIAIGQAK